MAGQFCVGIDYGDRTLSAAYSKDGTILHLPPTRPLEEPDCFFDPHSNISTIGVGFPSVLSSIGSMRPVAVSNRQQTPESLIQARLVDVHLDLQSMTASDTFASTVVSVPSGLTERKRKVLLEQCGRAGFDKVRLVDACPSAALAHSGVDERKTVLVYKLDYGVCEYSLVRLARGRCRVVGSGTVDAVSGQRIDALVMERTVLALREEQIFLGLKSFSPLQWLEFRALAESARRAFKRQMGFVIKLGTDLTDLAGSVELRFNARGWRKVLKPWIAKTVEPVEMLIERNDLDWSDVDSCLLVGEFARSRPIANLLAEMLDHEVRLADRRAVAAGAAIRASQLAGCKSPASDLNKPAVAPSEDWISEETDQEQVFVAVAWNEQASGRGKLSQESRQEADSGSAGGNSKHSPPQSHALPKAADMAPSLIRRVLSGGHYEQALGGLESLEKEIKQLRKEVEAKKPTAAQQLLRQAQALLVAQRYGEAVSLSHQAYSQAPDDPVVFRGMMRIHTESGLALDKPDQYETALRILTCAHGHDQTDRSVHQALAQRHFLHAEALRRLNNISKAIKTAEKALSHDPKHREANRLLQDLTDQQQ